MFEKLFKRNNVNSTKSQEKTNNNIKISSSLPDKNDINSQINWIISNGWTDNYDLSKKTLLIMDDREAITASVMDDLYSLEARNINFNLSDYNIVNVYSKMAGFHVIDILENAPLIEIHFAILDIILGGKKIVDGKRKMIDGVDVAIEIWKKFDSTEILFFSGCIIDSDTKDIFNFKNKFKEFTGDSIEDYILSKDSSFDFELKKLSEFFLGISI